jgi:hypothetical protein
MSVSPRAVTLLSTPTHWACGVLLAIGCAGESSHHGASEHAAGNGGRGAQSATAGMTATGGTDTKAGSGGSGTDGGTGGAVSGEGGSVSPRGGSAGGEAVGGDTSGGVGGMATLYPCVPSASGSGTLGECTNGFWHRPGPVMCSLPPRRMAETGGAGGETGNPLANTNNQCWFDSDCDDHPNGYCVATGKLGSYTFRCQYGCGSDADCGPREACSCDTQLVIEDSGVSERIPICLASNCTLDSECNPGFACLASFEYSCLYSGSSGFHCQTSADTCGPPNSGCARDQSCSYVHDHFECTDMPLCGGF